MLKRYVLNVLSNLNTFYIVTYQPYVKTPLKYKSIVLTKSYQQNKNI